MILYHLEEKRLSDTVTEFRVRDSFRRDHLYDDVSRSSYWEAIYSIYLMLASFDSLLLLPVLALISCYCVTGAISIIWSILAAITLPVFVYVCFSSVREESIIVMKDFGIQLRVTYRSGIEESKFVDKDKLKGVLLQECIYRNNVRFRMAFITLHEEELTICFHHLYPGVAALKRVYLACRQI